MSTGGRSEGTGNGGGYESNEPHSPAIAERSEPPREPVPQERAERSEPPREQQSSQAPLDLPPPPPSKPFVVWSSSPPDAPTPRRDE